MLTALSRQLELSKTGGGVQMVLLPSLSKAITSLDSVVKTIDDYQVTLLPAVPIFLEKLMDYLELHPQKKEMVKSLKTIISGGAALKEDTYRKLKALNPDMKIFEGYGSSEGGINLLNKADIPGFVGHPLSEVEESLA